MPGADWSDPVDHLLALDPGGRGIAAFFTPGAALAAATALRHASRVLITTGFAVAEGAGETDGPPGAAVVGRALRLLGARVAFVTDPVTVPLLEAALKVLGEPVDITVYPVGRNAAADVLDRQRPTHLIAIERPGRAASGDYLSARAESVAAWNRPLDDLFIGSGARGPGVSGVTRSRPGSARRRGSRSGPVTVGVGDGGNEIGMGNVRPRLVRARSPLARIASVVRTDHLVVAGTSNWGAYGIVVQLARLCGRPLLHSPDLERRMVEACVQAGAVDGITRRREATVDGLALSVHAAVVALLGLASSSELRGLAPASGMIGVTRGRKASR
ncbi:MAG TPA: DUF4392 domain-containing protein [Methylomirabilota bacterium]